MAKDTQAGDKKHDIVQWAFDRFYEGGFHASGIDAVMAGSGISKRTLYKYFPSKEDLVEAVLEHYTAYILRELFDPVMAASDDPRRQIMALFDIRKAMIDGDPIRGCLGIKAYQEYAGRHDGIATLGQNAALAVERTIVEMCQRAGFAQPAKLGKQINVLFQGAVLLSQVYGHSAPLASAKAAATALLDEAVVAEHSGKGRKAES